MAFYIKFSKPITSYILKFKMSMGLKLVVSRRKKMVAYPDYIDIRKIGINRTGLTTGENCRYSLTINIGGGEKRLICILMNPSSATESYSDHTVNNFIEYARNKKYQEIIILNVLPIYSTNVASAEKNWKDLHDKEYHEKKNLKVIEEIISYESEKNDIVMATGYVSGVKYKEKLREIYKLISKNEICSVTAFKGNEKFFTEKYCAFHTSRKGDFNTFIQNPFKFTIEYDKSKNNLTLKSSDQKRFTFANINIRA